MSTIFEIIGWIYLFILAVNLAIFLVFITTVFSRAASATLHQPDDPVDHCPAIARRRFVSVHLAIHDEPPDIVIATLSALRRLNYPDFEVVVIDNNTPSPSTWLPVQEYCSRDARLRFFHFSNVRGAKAGALNIALRLMHPLSDYVAVLDADYLVIPEFLNIAVSECEAQGHQFVQFPQAYRGAEQALAIARELGDYFAVYSSSASNAGAMLPTGTLSLICAATLRDVGGWPSSSITEDAEIGMRMWRLGASGRYIDRIVGRGMLPLDLHGLRCQRHRWAAGNARTLLSHLSEGVSRWPVHGRWSVVAQLMAWFGYGAIPLAGLATALAALEIDIGPSAVWLAVERVATGSLLAVLAGLVVNALLRRRLDTLPVKLAMLWTSSFAWLPQLWHSATPFLRTPKVPTALPLQVSLDTAISIFALTMALAYIRLGHAFPGVVLACSASTLIAAPFVDRALRRAAVVQPPSRPDFA